MGRLARVGLRIVLLLTLTLTCVWADSFRLYLKDGTYQQAREYEKLADRVRYYSVERSAWEELPLELVDLQRTESERKRVVEEERKLNRAADEEEKFEREQAAIVARVPQNAGVYWFSGQTPLALKQAESKIVNNKRRSALKVLTPLPVVAGKATIELDGVASRFPLDETRPEFWFRLANPERFGIVKCTVKKDSRVVETWQIAPITKEILAERQLIEIFRQQVGDGLYKIWPQKPLEPGEYAVIEYSEGESNTQVWDFSVQTKK